jgi:hypothetical protein
MNFLSLIRREHRTLFTLFRDTFSHVLVKNNLIELIKTFR